MCGISGILGPGAGSERSRALVADMAAKLAHRGPDDTGFAHGNNFAFGHRRLSIIDIEHGHQPMYSEDGRFVLVYNGELYNFVELRQKLIQNGARFSTFSDTEVLLKALIAEGEQALPRLNGMFAFAFLDTQSGDWLLARDAFGIKPLYFSPRDDRIVFASEIKALLCDSSLRAEADWHGMEQYLTFQFCLGEQTMFRNVRRIEPGCAIIGNGGEIKRITRYWDTDYHIDEAHHEDYFADRLRVLLNDSVHLQTRSDVPVGAYLSGGIDSSVIATLAAQYIDGPSRLFHGHFADGPQYDESHHARTVANGITNSQLHFTAPTAADFVADMPKLIYAMDEPVAGPGLFPQYRVSKLAAQHVKVVLGGQGGDEIFGGYARYLIGYLEQALKGAIYETQEEGRHLVTLASIIPNLPLLRDYQPLMQTFWREGLFEDMDRRYFRLIDRSPDLNSILTDDALARFDEKRAFGEFQRIFNHPDTRSFFNKMTHFDLKSFLPALLQVEDRVSMAVSLESRVPLLDTRIVDLVTRMPPSIKFNGGQAKHILKCAADNIVPASILKRKDKMGFPVPFSEWLKGGPVHDFVGDTLLGQRSRERGLFRHAALERLIQAEGRFGRQLWGALCLELWHQTFIDQ
ncbi:MAG: asparagine synthase (glutamine-hydrolyzing) [Betaproteobacteria bacterium]|nr:asparagine synthase (glutamine-hydrolyzing) [Betaproteobacteria bacterium]